MDFHTFTVSSFFGQPKVKFTIPSYQRAYSWEEAQWSQFLDDLYDHRHSTKETPYSYGSILLQVISNDEEYGIIDGQQRITTLSIFVRVLLNEILHRQLQTERVVVSDEERIYFKDYGIIKLHPVEYDKGCYDTIIIENKDSFNCTTPSQKRMVAAKKWFSQKLQHMQDVDISLLFNTLGIARLNVIELSGNKESALMFELQNNRGKKLTNLESLKSFFMYQMYIYSEPESVETNIDYISNLFAPIYKLSNDLNELLIEGDYENERHALSEDNILLYHCYAYGKLNFGYRNLGDTIDEFKEITDENKVSWIKQFVLELYNSFTNLKTLLTYKDSSLAKLKRLGIPSFAYPFILKGMKYNQNDRDSFSELLRILEVMSFRYKLINSRADIRGRLSMILRSFSGNVNQLASSIREKMNAEQYWGDTKIAEVLNGKMYQNPVIHYLLWEYEESIQKKGYSFGSIHIEDESIEHISPRTEDDEWVKSGYEVDANNHYSQEFIDSYLNKLGNLVLISKSHNSKIGNHPFVEKLDSFVSNPLLVQQSEISSFIDENNPIWNSSAIDKRHAKITEFALKRWSF